jgi:hypothetical protein
VAKDHVGHLLVMFRPGAAPNISALSGLEQVESRTVDFAGLNMTLHLFSNHYRYSNKQFHQSRTLVLWYRKSLSVVLLGAAAKVHFLVSGGPCAD